MSTITSWKPYATTSSTTNRILQTMQDSNQHSIPYPSTFIGSTGCGCRFRDCKNSRMTIHSITAAGICPDEPFLERNPESVKRCFEINSLGTYYSAQLAARQMTKQPRLENSASAGSIVMVASIAAHQASLGQYTSDYCSSKGAVLSLSRQLSVELARPGIRVNCLSPG